MESRKIKTTKKQVIKNYNYYYKTKKIMTEKNWILIIHVTCIHLPDSRCYSVYEAEVAALLFLFLLRCLFYCRREFCVINSCSYAKSHRNYGKPERPLECWGDHRANVCAHYQVLRQSNSWSSRYRNTYAKSTLSYERCNQ